MQLKHFFILTAILLFANNFYSQVGIGTSNPSSVARMEVSSQTDGVGSYRGFILPRVPDLTARDAIAVSSSDEGLLVYVEAIGCLQMWNGFNWLDVTCAPTAAIGSAIQDFESPPGTPELPIFRETGGGENTSEVVESHFPNTPLYASGVEGFGVNNGTSTLILGPINVSGYTDITFKLRLAGFSLNNSTNGMDNTDTVIVSISTTGTGGAFSDELIVIGGPLGDSNNTWGFDATREESTVYDGDGTPTVFTSGEGNNATTGGISYLEITGIPNSANLAIKIELLNDKSNELWVIDDAQLIAN